MITESIVRLGSAGSPLLGSEIVEILTSEVARSSAVVLSVISLVVSLGILTASSLMSEMACAPCSLLIAAVLLSSVIDDPLSAAASSTSRSIHSILALLTRGAVPKWRSSLLVATLLFSLAPLVVSSVTIHVVEYIHCIASMLEYSSLMIGVVMASLASRKSCEISSLCVILGLTELVLLAEGTESAASLTISLLMSSFIVPSLYKGGDFDCSIFATASFLLSLGLPFPSIPRL